MQTDYIVTEMYSFNIQTFNAFNIKYLLEEGYEIYSTIEAPPCLQPLSHP